MPTESKKKKSKKEESKLSLLIKSEPKELKSLEHYVDDPVELIRQIFDSLKTKTIESIIPEFLQEKSIEEIQEICLEEVLGISKKRLLSIINATKCPTDTESSDSDSDVEKIEEHISLEEISSDSNDELSKPKKKKKRESKKETASKIVATSTKTTEQNGKNPEKQYSVLELLELQARARAIRSQLALEPVTKIELDDSDGETPSNVKDNETSVEKVTKPSQKKSCNKKGIDELDQLDQPEQSEEQSKVPPTRPVRLKRNFRQRQMEGYESDEIHAMNDQEKSETTTVEAQVPEKPAEKEKSPVKEAHPITTNDDDVVPIIAEPEILCISSSDSENEDKNGSSKVKKYINMPVVEKEVRPPTEDELFLLKIKEKSEAKSKGDNSSVIKDTKAAERTLETNNESQSKESLDKQPDVNKQEDEEEMEDGEIIEEDEIVEIPESPESLVEQKSDETNVKEKTMEVEKTTETGNKSAHRVDKRRDKSKGSRSSSESDSESGSSSSEDSGSESDNSESKAKSQTSKKSNVDDDDDDIIDLGKDEDLDFEQLEMSTASEEPQKEETTRRTRSKTTKSNTEPDKESPDEPKDESWDKRWLRGNKVSKVLATAKLANKVRSKIKEKKTKTTAPSKAEEVEAPKETVSVIPSNVEVGSVEHYKELTKQK